MSQYLHYLPALSQATSAAQPGIDMSQAKSAAATAPIYNQSALSMYGKYGPALNAIGQSIGASNAKQGQTVNTGLLASGGTQTANALALEKQASPEYYSTMQDAAGKTKALMDSINLNGLSGSERSEVERSLGQSQTATGNLGLDNATNAVGNAMTFGSALQGKRDALASAIGTATNFLPQSKASFDPVNLALGNNPSTSQSTGSATNQFQGVPSTGGQAFSMGTNTLNNLNQSNMGNMAMQYDENKSNSFGGILGSQTSAIGNVCCFIFLEAYNGTLPWWIRKCRDRYYRVCPEVADGYRRMAKWLVPMMQQSILVRFVVNRWMIQPLTLYGGFVRRVDSYHECRTMRSYRRFWFTIWKAMGKR